MQEEHPGNTEAVILRGVAAVYTIAGVIGGLVIWNKLGTTTSYATQLEKDAAALWAGVAIATIAQAIMFGAVMYGFAAICENVAEIASNSKPPVTDRENTAAS